VNAAPRARRALAVACAASLLALAACGRDKTPKVDADADAERAAALERSKKAAFGSQVNALETAKGLEADVNQKAQASVDNAEKDAK
jgi:hypothetical protein